jgi:hypothetical protein
MNHAELVSKLLDKGFADGWVLSGETLILWEHDADPPEPLTRPEPTDETPIAG